MDKKFSKIKHFVFNFSHNYIVHNSIYIQRKYSNCSKIDFELLVKICFGVESAARNLLAGSNVAQGARHSTPLHFSAIYSYFPLAVTKLGFCALEAMGKQDPRALYSEHKKLFFVCLQPVITSNTELILTKYTPSIYFGSANGRTNYFEHV